MRLRGPIDENSLCCVLRALLVAKVETVVSEALCGSHVFVFCGQYGDLVKLKWGVGDGIAVLAIAIEDCPSRRQKTQGRDDVFASHKVWSLQGKNRTRLT